MFSTDMSTQRLISSAHAAARQNRVSFYYSNKTCPTLQQVTHVTEEPRFQKQVLSTDTLPPSWGPPCGSGCSTEQSTTGSNGWASNTHGITPTKQGSIEALLRRRSNTFHPFFLLYSPPPPVNNKDILGESTAYIYRNPYTRRWVSFHVHIYTVYIVCNTVYLFVDTHVPQHIAQHRTAPHRVASHIHRC